MDAPIGRSPIQILNQPVDVGVSRSYRSQTLDEELRTYSYI